MKKGTTPTHWFVLPFEVDKIEKVEITYCQNKCVVLQLDKDRCTFDEKTVRTKLSQEETFLFSEEYPVEIQLRVLTKEDASAFASDVFTVSCKRCLSAEVL